MCGILGLFSKEADLCNFKQSLNLMIHRGPDDFGIDVVDDNFFFGHRRLSIQDLTKNGSQPIFSRIIKLTIQKISQT